MHFHKYHALGNDYLILETTAVPNPKLIQRLCHRNMGVGSDGLLIWQNRPDGPPFKLRIFNPDGSEAEKSGNGLRIFGRYLFDLGHVGHTPFAVQTKGGFVTLHILPDLNIITEMGQITFHSQSIPMTGPPREVVNEPFVLNGRTLHITAASVGNPHCVVMVATATAELAHTIGPQLENDPRFPRRTNVQIMQVLDHANIRIEIWERGAGYTLASGSSSCAAAAAAHRLGLCHAALNVHMPGGTLAVQISPDYQARLTGVATPVYQGHISPAWLQDAIP